jgi:phosphatidylethanolamine-binding protein (PEBP) family uncharacterized protein
VLISSLNIPKDAEIKPTSVDPNKKTLSPNTDDYARLSVPWKEVKADKAKKIVPQTGSLIGLEASALQDSTTPTTDSTTSTPTTPTTTEQQPGLIVQPAPETPKGNLQEIPLLLPKTEGTVKADVNTAFPVKYNINGGAATAAYAGSVDKVAPPPIPDPKLQDVHGVQPEPVVFSRPEDFHPMEVVTPLIDNFPCDPDRILNVHVPAAYYDTFNQSIPNLPLRYGCSSPTDNSREKASPEITWSNVYEDVVDFSLQMIELGDGCAGKGPDFGRILWHISDIKSSPSIRLQEGASHDTRLIFGGKEHPNQWLEEYYSGPCPAVGTTGCYRFKVLAHRASGNCQCGHFDVQFNRPAKAQEWTYEKPADIQFVKKD